MGTIPKKPAPKKTAKKAVKRPTTTKSPKAKKVSEAIATQHDMREALQADSLSIPDRISTLLERLLFKVKPTLTVEGADPLTMTEADLDALATLWEIHKAADAAKKKATALLKDLRNSKLIECEVGDVDLQFKDTSKVSPKWKDEAVRLGKEVALAKGEVFNEDVFVSQIAATYRASTSTSISFQRINPEPQL